MFSYCTETTLHIAYYSSLKVAEIAATALADAEPVPLVTHKSLIGGAMTRGMTDSEFGTYSSARGEGWE